MSIRRRPLRARRPIASPILALALSLTLTPALLPARAAAQSAERPAATLPAATQNADPGAAVDSDWILRLLARPAPMRTSFVEFRDSPLLKTPLRLSGEYQRPDARTLVREVRMPYVETTTLQAGQATIARAGKAPRRFSLARAPELADLQASFGAMLSGDRAALERYYRVQAAGTRRQWTLTLAPRDAALAARVREVVLYGRGAELRCIETLPAKGREIQRTLLAGAARDADALSAPQALTALCHGAETK